MGEGRSIQIWDDRWCLEPDSRLVTLWPSQVGNKWIAVLIDQDLMCWQYDLVDTMFDKADAPLSVNCRQDIFTQGMVDFEEFLVKSAYYLAYALRFSKIHLFLLISGNGFKGSNFLLGFICTSGELVEIIFRL